MNIGDTIFCKHSFKVAATFRLRPKRRLKPAATLNAAKTEGIRYLHYALPFAGMIKVK
jgi:hypothetical protein